MVLFVGLIVGANVSRLGRGEILNVEVHLPIFDSVLHDLGCVDHVFFVIRLLLLAIAEVITLGFGELEYVFR